MQTITFNTKRPYTKEGQIITATFYGNGFKDISDFYLNVSEDSLPENDPYVIFEDHSRNIKGKITLCSLDEYSIMEAYDKGRYTDC